MESAGTGRVALVTGAAKRVGRAVVERLAGAGFDIAFTFLRSRAEAEELAGGLRGAGRRVVAVWADLTDPERNVGSVVAAVQDTFGRLDVLVNNASAFERGSLSDADLQQSRRLWAIHVESPLLLCQRLAGLLRQSRGHVVNMLDVLAERPQRSHLAYCASKAGLWNLTLSLARELAPEVTVNGIAPGAVEWPDDMTPDQRERYLRRVPLGRAGSPADVAEAVLFLCTGGSYMTGQVLRLDGGRSIT